MRFRSRRLIGASAFAAVLALGACGQVAGPASMCRKDSQCPGGSSCVLGACVPRINGTTQTWALELVPKSESSYAPTENAAVTFTSEPAQLRVELKARIDGDITGIDPGVMNAGKGALPVIPSAIGKGDRQFESEATRSPDDKSRLGFALFVPESAVGRPAKITLFPAAPLDQVLPVWTQQLAPLSPSVIIEAPKSDKLSTVVGVLQDETDQPVVGYVARALLGDRLVSNVYKTDAQGRFQLKIPSGEANAVNLDQVKVDLAPGDPNSVDPRLTANLTAVKPNLGILHLPPRPKAQVLDIPVNQMGTVNKIPGVTLRFWAPLPMAVGGTASVLREFQTDKDGVAHVTLLPGLAGQPREYSVVVVPPPNSEFATRCFSSYAVATVPPGQARVGATIELVNKLEVVGQVTDSTGTAQSGVILTAIRAKASTQDCGADALAAQTTATTGSDGRYRLLLDPGRYRIEYEPPMGSASALFVEPEVVVDKRLERGVQLPGGVLATGVVSAPGGEGVVGCEVRVFGAPKDGQAPELRARTRTVTDGHFSIVLPKNP